MYLVFPGEFRDANQIFYFLGARKEQSLILVSHASRRNPANMKIPAGSGGADAGKLLTDPKLTMIAGDVTKQVDVDKLFENDIDGVIIALGGKTADVGETMLTDGTKNVISAMKKKGVKRLAVVTSIGAGDSENQAPFFFKVSIARMRRKNCALYTSLTKHNFCRS
jgi:nucleoside-diphosphate-sugar epimerase